MLTSNGNFLFNMDSGRDMVDVREMVVEGKPRLTGPTSAIEGLFNGPAWYYLLAVPFVISSGNPYASIIMEIILWAIGGFFLLKLAKGFGKLPMIAVGSVWVASNYVVLTNLYAFNPNPVLLLTPLFIYLLKRYIETGRLLFSASCFFLAGLFFNFEMNFGIFTPVIILAAIVLSGNKQFLKTKNFFVGLSFFILTLLPQIFFDIRHEFIMSKSVFYYLATSQDTSQISNSQKFYDVLSATFMNVGWLTLALIVLFFIILFKTLKTGFWKKELVVLICLLFIFVPFLGYVIIPTTVNPWHLGAVSAASILMVAYVVKRLNNFANIAFLVITFYAVLNITNFFRNDFGKPSSDPSSFKNEIAAIDYVYQKAEGKNFKVYAYLPSVYDYPYQYLFWWYGLKKYGFVPGEYAYSPNKPQYISNKEKFEGRKDNFSGLVFLIKEPDRIGLRQAWENDFKNMKFISKETAGPLEIEIRREVNGL